MGLAVEGLPVVVAVRGRGVESGDRLCATAAAALGAAAGVTANTGLEHGCISFEGVRVCLLQKVRYQHLRAGKFGEKDER